VGVFSGDFSTSSRNLGIMILIISFLNSLAIILTLFMINFRPQDNASSNQAQDPNYAENQKL